MWSDRDHLDKEGMDDVGLSLGSPGQLGLGGRVALLTHCIHRVGTWLDVHLQRLERQDEASDCLLR